MYVGSAAVGQGGLSGWGLGYVACRPHRDIEEGERVSQTRIL